MSHALVEAAREAGIRIALLDTCYLTAGIGRPPEGVQQRFSDGDAEAWAARLSRRAVTAASTRRETGCTSDGSAVRWGARSTRCAPCPATRCRTVAGLGRGARGAAARAPLRAGRRERRLPGGLRRDADRGARARPARSDRAPRAVHATHLTASDVALLGGSRTRACFCPTTERDLGDGIGPSRRLLEAGAPLTLGSDSHAVIDLFEEMRAVELDERLATRERGHWSAEELLARRDVRRARVARLRRGRADRGRGPGRPGHPRHRHRPHRRHRRRRGHRRVRRVRAPTSSACCATGSTSPATRPTWAPSSTG